ncbi:hypothetical protein TNCV_1769601 [Trichonephila clavipes]|nr:hypothetical protein TNCV_1769601 [Trichonephila clavipes]
MEKTLHRASKRATVKYGGGGVMVGGRMASNGVYNERVSMEVRNNPCAGKLKTPILLQNKDLNTDDQCVGFIA